MTAASLDVFRPLTGIYEPSAIQQLPDGRLLVVEDEKTHPFSAVTLHAGGIRVEALRPGFFDFDRDLWKMDDLEGLALDRTGRVVAITSHSRDGDGDDKKSRRMLARFRIEGDDIVDRQVTRGLKAALIAAHPVLAEAAAVRDVKAQGGLNIEALEISPDTGRLWIGLRGPLLAGRAILVGLDNLDAVFDAAVPPRIAPDLITLDLEGNGLRGMCWVAALGGYLLIAGPVTRAEGQFQLWFWDGQAHTAARRVTVPGQASLGHAEGICPAVIDGREMLVIVSDDGDRKAGRSAGYLLVEPGQLRIAA
jgi:hypothetical protein